MYSKFSITTKNKSGKKYFYVRFRDPDSNEYGNQKSVDVLSIRLGRTPHHITKKTEAYEVCEEAVEVGLIGNNEDDPVFVDYVKKFWTWEKSPYIKRMLRRDPNSISYNYCRNCYGYFVNHVEKLLPANLKASRLKLKHIENALEEILETGSISMWENCLKSIATPIRELMRKHIIIENPLLGLERIKNNQQKTRGILTEVETMNLMDQMRRDVEYGFMSQVNYRWRNGERTENKRAYLDKRVYLATALAITTGMREGELLALTPEAFRFTSQEDDQAIITVSKSYAVRVGDKTTKGKKTRHVTCPAWLAHEIIEFEETNTTEDCPHYVFYSDRDPRKPINSRVLRVNLYRALNRIGISDHEIRKRNICFHSLRHYCNTRTTEIAGQAEAMLRIGHENTATSDHYYHIQEQHLLEVGSKLLHLIPTPTEYNKKDA